MQKLPSIDLHSTIKQAHPSTPIIDAVELVQTLQAQNREATPDEQAILARWMGWGPVAPAFESAPEGQWARVCAQLRMLLGPEGFKAASAATPTSYFTSSLLAEAIWTIAEELGFQGGKVLEPGCGSGAVLAAAPSRLQLEMVGVEREPFAASVAQARLPRARIINSALEKFSLPNGSFDLVIGNVPFSSVHIYDRLTDVRFSIHNYFIWRALMALRPGGLAILITSRYTLDAERDVQREELGRLGCLLGAIRLPSGAHKEAITKVVTDILVFQRRSDELTWRGQDWMSTTTEAIPGTTINRYFLTHPDSIIGTPKVGRGLYRQDELVVDAPDDLSTALRAGIARVVAEAKRHGAIYLPPIDRTVISEALVPTCADGFKEGSYQILLDGKLVQILDGQARLVAKKPIAELSALVRLRNATTALLEAERDLDCPDADLVPLRRTLNRCYDSYVKAHGPIHRATIIVKEDPETGEQSITRRRPPAMSAFSQDPDYSIVLGLEDYDDTTQIARKAPLFSQRVHVRMQRKTRADSPGEALALCLDEHGRLDFETIGYLLQIPIAQVSGALGDLVYEDPQTKHWETASEYLSGNIRIKLGVARRAAQNEPERFGRNVMALEREMPEDLLPEEIKAILGAPWISVSDIEQFCLDTFGMRPVVSHERLTGGWQVSSPTGCRDSAAATSEWGTRRMNAYRLVEHGLNKLQPIVHDTLPDERTVKNVEETLAAQDKLRVIQARFSAWVWEDPARAKRLAAVYNERFNSVVPRQHDGSHLTFLGMSEQWQANLYSWQKDFIWRMVSSPSALCGHPVGAGKTTTEIAGAMTLRRMGLTSKAAIVVPNHLLEQITAEAQRLYPAANILMVSRDDLSRDRRKLFAARVATGNYDFVVMTHSGLSAIGVHPETERAYIEQRLDAYRQALLEADENDPHSKYGIKKLETAIEKMMQRQEELLDKKRDDGVTFEQLGISYLIVDEAHLYKNLGLPSNIQGLQVKPSKRATDLEMKLRWLEAHNQGHPYASFFTATPLSNSMVEAYVLAWYLAQKRLFDYGLRSVDAFASVFIDFQTRVEVSPNGASFRLYTRPARFVNMPEFLSLFTQFADLRGPEILSAKRPQRIERTITLEPSDAVQEYVDELVVRSEEIAQGRPRSIGGKMDNMLWVTSHGRMAALDLSLVGRPQECSPKLEAVASHMLEVWRRWQVEAAYLDGEHKSLQIGFCDLGTPDDEKGDQIYGRLKRLLIVGGIPANAIRYIHEAKSDSAKAQLFQKCRTGQVAVLLGSTTMLGTGTNIQTRCAAIHHIDAPWRPDEVEQREGRAQRPGNLYPVVEIFRYVQQRTFDAYSWQTLTNKAVFFDQMRNGKIKGREMEELGDSALSYGQVKAAATGDPLVLEQADLSVTQTNLQRLRSAHLRARKRDEQEVTTARNRAAEAAKRADLLHEIVRRAANAPVPGFATRQQQPLAERSEAGEYIAQHVLALLNREGGVEPIGRWSDLPVLVQVSKRETMYLAELLVGGVSSTNPIRLHISQEWLAKGQQWRFAHAIEQFFGHTYDDAIQEQVAAEQCLTRAADFERRSREPFPQEQELLICTARKNEVDAYIALAAAAKNDPQKQEEVQDLRARLLADAPKEEIKAPTALIQLAPPRRPQPLTAPQTPASAPVLLHAVSVQETSSPQAEQPQPSVEQTPVTVAPVSPAPSTEPKTRKTAAVAPARTSTKATLVFGNLDQIQRARQPRSQQKKQTTNAPALLPTSNPQPSVTRAPKTEAVSSSTLLATANGAQEEATIVAPARMPSTKATLVFGNLDHIQHARQPCNQKRATDVPATVPSQAEQAQPPVVQNPVPLVTAPSDAPSMEAGAQKAPAAIPTRMPSTKATLVFGNLDQIQLARQPRLRKKSSTSISSAPVVSTVTEKPAPIQPPAPHQAATKATLVFGNLDQIQLLRQRCPKSTGRSKPAREKRAVYVEYPARCMEVKESTLQPRAASGQRSLWELDAFFENAV